MIAKMLTNSLTVDNEMCLHRVNGEATSSWTSWGEGRVVWLTGPHFGDWHTSTKLYL